MNTIHPFNGFGDRALPRGVITQRGEPTGGSGGQWRSAARVAALVCGAVLLFTTIGAFATWSQAAPVLAGAMGSATHDPPPHPAVGFNQPADIEISVDGQIVTYTLTFCPLASWLDGDSGPYFGSTSVGAARGSDGRTWGVFDAVIEEIQDGTPTDWRFSLGTPADAESLTDLEVRWDSEPVVHFFGGESVSGLTMHAELSDSTATFATEFVDFTRKRSGRFPGTVTVTCAQGLVTPEPAASAGETFAPSVAPSVETTMVPSVVPVSTTAPGGIGASGPGAFAGSIVAPRDVPLNLPAIVQGLVVAALALLLIPFPSQLFNSTLEANYDEVRGWFGWLRRPKALARVRGLWSSPPGIALFLALSSLLYALLNPTFGLHAASMAEVVGMGIGIAVTTAVFAVPQILAHRRLGDPWRVQVLPGTIVVGVACVLVSRLTSFEPGYLYGLLLGLTFGRTLSRDDEGRLNAIGAVVMVVVAVIAWFALELVGSPSDVVGLALETALGATMVAGLESAAIGLVPLRFQPGAPVYAWNRMAWAGMFAISMFTFVLLLVNPNSDYLADSSRTPLFTIIGLLVLFAGVSIGFWAYFRFRRPRVAAEATETRR